jgi:hypothetical protein
LYFLVFIIVFLVIILIFHEFSSFSDLLRLHLNNITKFIIYISSSRSTSRDYLKVQCSFLLKILTGSLLKTLLGLL